MSKDFVESILDETRPSLTDFERARMWEAVAAKTKQLSVDTQKQPVRSPYLAYVRRYALAPLLLIFFVATGAVTHTVAEAAKPGDTLFPLEQALERTRLAFAFGTHKQSLEAAFATERLSELRMIIAEEAVTTKEVNIAMFSPTVEVASFDAVAADSATADSFSMMTKMAAPVSDLAVEAIVFEDVSVVYVTQYGSRSSFTMQGDVVEDIAESVAERYGVEAALVSPVTTLVREDRPSRPSDRGDVIPTVAGEARVGAATSALLDQLETVEDSAMRDMLLSELLKEISGVQTKRAVPGGSMNSYVQIDDKRIEVEYDGYKVHIDDGIHGDDGKGDDRSDDDKRGRGGDDSEDLEMGV